MWLHACALHSWKEYIHFTQLINIRIVNLCVLLTRPTEASTDIADMCRLYTNIVCLFVLLALQQETCMIKIKEDVEGVNMMQVEVNTKILMKPGAIVHEKLVHRKWLLEMR